MSMESPQPTKEHLWLQKLIGEWNCAGECVMAPGQEPMRSQMTESVRAMGDLWIIIEGKGEMPGGAPMTYLMTLGYDPVKKKFVGTWSASCMTNLFVYEGVLDEAKGILPLDTVGPDCSDPTKSARYQDVHEFDGKNGRAMWSLMLGPDGKWVRFMTGKYTRVK